MEFRAPRTPLVPPAGIECHVRDMTATISADLTLEAAQARLREFGQWIPIDGNPDSSIGQLVSENSTGPLRLGYGAWRDLLLGAQFTNGRGELITAGGKTVKNVAGYDLTKFVVGQHGIFADLVNLTTRTYHRPDNALLVRYPPDPAILSRLVPTALRPQWALLNGDALLLGYLADERTLEHYRNSLPETVPLETITRTLDEDVAHRAKLWAVRDAPAFRASVPPARVMEFATSTKPRGWVADPAFGIVLGPGSNDELERQRLTDSAAALGGSVSFTRSHHGGFDFSTNPVERQIIERLKHAFDPEAKLNPLPWRTP